MCTASCNNVHMWVPAVPGHIPHRAVIFEKRHQGDLLYVARTDQKRASSFETIRSCAEYSWGHHPHCIENFDFLVLTQSAGQHCGVLRDVLIVHDIKDIPTIGCLSNF